MCEFDSGFDSDVSGDTSGFDSGSDADTSFDLGEMFEAADIDTDISFETTDSFNDLESLSLDDGFDELSDGNFENSENELEMLSLDGLDNEVNTDTESYQATPLDEINIIAESGNVESIAHLQAQLEEPSEPYVASEPRDLPYTDETGDVSTYGEVMDVLNSETDGNGIGDHDYSSIGSLESSADEPIIEQELETISELEQRSDTNIEEMIDSADSIQALNGIRESLFSDELNESLNNELSELSLDGFDPETTDFADNEHQEQIVESEPELSITQEELEQIVEGVNDSQRLSNLRDAIQSGRLTVETNNISNEEEDSPKTLTREITPEILESRELDTEETLNNYAENLMAHGIRDERVIEEFINQEREGINAEYESLDAGDISSNVYHPPTNWSEVAESLSEQPEVPDLEAAELQNQPDIFEQLVEQATLEDNAVNEIVEQTEQVEPFDETQINFDEILEGVAQESLSQGFEHINIDTDSERLTTSLGNFNDETWQGLTLDEQKGSMADLADYVSEVVGFDNPPTIEYYNNEKEGDYGGFDSSTNTLRVNEYMLYNSAEAADTIAHELWHAHQHECALNPQNAREYQYQYNFHNYITPDLGQKAYENQLVEAEARAFAAQFKDRLQFISGRSR